MFLVERIIGLAVYYLTLFLITFFIYRTNKIKCIKIYLLIYLIFLMIMAYFYIPKESADLYRHFNTLNKYTSISNETFINIIKHSTSPLSTLYFKAISLMNNVHMLPTITCFIYYGVLFKLYGQFCEKYKISGNSVALSLLLFMIGGKYLGLISGIRNGLSFILLIKCFYNEFICNKTIAHNLIYYIGAILMHPSALIVVLIRFIYLLFERKNNGIKKAFNIIIVILISFMAVKYNNEIIKNTFIKGSSYVNNSVYFNIWEQLISALNILIIFITAIRDKENDNHNIVNLRKFILLFSSITLLYSFEHSIFSRFQGFANLLFIFYFAYILNKIKLKEIKMKKYSFFIYFSIILIFLLSITRGDITALKFS